ncbi:ATP-dependent Clp protease proteolytic subunit [Faecalicoccus pleomorphus]|uniref:ATP-dependent Clp protease proteolytic subunit n=1 Tax=Faecalicoccus pleomorphus TaxID=1323 RepID=UPI0039F57BA1
MNTTFLTRKSPYGLEKIDAHSAFSNDFQISVHEPITNESAMEIIELLLVFQKNDPKRRIDLFISSPRGSIAAGFMIKGVVDILLNPIRTIACGSPTSMGAVLAIILSKDRYALPYTRFMLHQPMMEDFSGQTSDFLIYAKEMENQKKLINRLLMENSSLSEMEINALCDRDSWINVDQAIEMGFISNILQKGDLYESE